VVVASKLVPGSPAGEGPLLSLYVDSLARVLESPLRMGGITEALATITQAQERHALAHRLRTVEPGRFVGGLDIWAANPNPEGAEERGLQGGEGDSPRYTLSIVDQVPPSGTPLPCGVFLIPQGREHEWIFATEEGLKQVW
jgi:hypothetical protein